MSDLILAVDEGQEALGMVRAFRDRGIASADECVMAETAYAEARRRLKDVIQSRQDEVKELKAEVNKIEARYRPAVQVWEEVGVLLSKAVQDFRLRERRAKERMLADASNTTSMVARHQAVIAASTLPVRSDRVGYRTVTSVQVTDPKAFYAWCAEHPEEAALYAPVNITALSTSARSGKELPAGTEVTERQQLVSGRR